MYKTLLACVVALLAHAAAQDCRVKLTEPGTFSSPNFPQSYNSNLHCTWEIQGVKGLQISLQFTQFALEKSVNCTKDAVIVYEGDEEITKLCGTDPPVAIKSKLTKSDNILIVLRTDSKTNLKGFEANWTLTCGGEYHATEEEQYISSPGYPNYLPNMHCTYDIYAPKGQKVLIKFLNFDLYGTDYDCKDYLKFYRWEMRAYKGEEAKPVMVQKAHYCGDSKVQNDYFEDHLSIIFNSNKQNERKGFLIAFSFFKECGGKIIKPTVITPSLLPSYAADTHCTWIIEAPENKVVKVKFPFISLNYGVFCDEINREKRDIIKIYDGLKPDTEKRLAAICGWSHEPIVVPASGNTMTVDFSAYKGGKGFEAEVIFTYPESDGCGGTIDMTSINSYELKSPKIMINNNKDVLDCQWNILAPQKKVIRVKFSSFDLSECVINNSVSEDGKCKCNFLEFRDGFLPDSFLIGSYCDHSLPNVVSSKNRISIRLLSGSTSNFVALLTVEESMCPPINTHLSHLVQHFQSPGYESGSIPRGIHCRYEFHSSQDLATRLLIKNLDILSGTTPKVCDKDRLVIGRRSDDNTIGKDFKMYSLPIVTYFGESSFNQHNLYANVNHTHQYEICGTHEFVELYIEGPFFINLITSSERNSKTHKGIEFEISYGLFCDRNYTEPYGRIQSTTVEEFNQHNDCYTLITAPENRTISVYFISYPSFLKNPNTSYQDIYDGNSMTSNKLVSTKGRGLRVGEVIAPVFSTGRYMLIHNVQGKEGKSKYDLNYITTDKGRGCGGYLYSDQGAVTSPFYPNVYRESRTCEWVLETPLTTRLHLKFSDFKMCGRYDKRYYVQLLNRDGEVKATFYNTWHRDEYFSDDNYVKIVYTTSPEICGAGWAAIFAAVSSQ